MTTEPDRNQLFRQEEAAALLCVTARCLENWRYRGKGPKYVRISKTCIRYRKLDLDLFIEDRIRQSTSEENENDHFTPLD